LGKDFVAAQGYESGGEAIFAVKKMLIDPHDNGAGAPRKLGYAVSGEAVVPALDGGGAHRVNFGKPGLRNATQRHTTDSKSLP
jgi:hypothetical protein